MQLFNRKQVGIDMERCLLLSENNMQNNIYIQIYIRIYFKIWKLIHPKVDSGYLSALCDIFLVLDFPLIKFLQ